MRRRVAAALLAGAAVTAAIYAYGGGSEPDGTWQGWVEADLLFVGAEDSGRLEALGVEEGARVIAGQPLFVMESDLQRADRSAAQAAVSAARATLERAGNAQKRPEEIAILQAQAARASAALEASKGEYERVRALADKGISSRARLDQARAAYDSDLAGLAEIHRQIDLAGLSARSEDIEEARQALNRAEAQLAAADIRLANATVAAPGEATVQEIYYRPGEIVPAGRPVVSLLPPGQLKIRFFVPQAALPLLGIGAPVAIACDGCGDGLRARIGFIARQAEFTPPVIYSREERAKLVFRVEARPDTPEAFRIGQPVDVRLSPEQAE